MIKVLSQLYYSITIIALCSNPVFANGEYKPKPELKPYKATYHVKKKGSVIAELTYQLKQDAESWKLNTAAKPKGLAALVSNLTIKEESLFKLQHGLVSPISYSLAPSQKNSKNPPVKIEYKPAKANHSSGSTNTTLTHEGPAYDSLSLQTQLMLDAQQNKANIDYQVIDDGQLQNQQYTKQAEELVSISRKQKHKAVKYSRSYGNKEVHMWFAPELNYLLVKMQKYRKGKLKSELVLKKAKFDL